jgi:hypothetical protein
MGFWFSLLLFAVTFTVGQLFSSRRKSSGVKPADQDPLADPTGQPIPVIWGRCKVAPAVVWWGDNKSTPRTQTLRSELFGFIPAGSEKIVIGHKYYLGMQAAICWGEIEALYEIWLEDGKRLSQIGTQLELTGLPSIGDWTVEYTPRPPIVANHPVAGSTLPIDNPPGGVQGQFPTQLDIFAPTVFGGDIEEGGLEGLVDFHWGHGAQGGNSYLGAKMDPNGVSGFPSLCYAVFRQVMIGFSPRLKPMWFEVGRYPSNLGDATKARIENPDVAGTYDANPAEAIYEILTDALWARFGITATDIDVVSFQAARDTLYDEQLGISGIVRDQTTGEELIDDILRHIDGVLFEHPLTGLLTLKLARDDYDPLTIPTVDASVYPEPPHLSRDFFADLISDVRVVFHDRAKAYKEQVALAQNLALQHVLGEVRGETFEFRFLTSSTVANKVAWRVLQTTSRPLWRGTVPVTRALAHLTIGDVFKLTVSEYGLSDHIMRITNARYGDAEGARPEFEVIEDIFADPVTPFIVPPVSTWPGPDVLIVPPFVEVVLSSTATIGTLGVIVFDPHGLVTAIEVNTQVGNGTPSGWVAINPTTHEATVALDPKHPSTIAWRVTYQLPDLTTDTIEGFEIFSPAGTPGTPVLTLSIDGSGNVTAGVAGDSDTNRTRAAAEVGSAPADATVDAGSPDTSAPFQHVFSQASTGLLVGETLFVKARAYNSAGDGGPYVTQAIQRVS